MGLEQKLEKWLPLWLYKIVATVHDLFPWGKVWTDDENGNTKW